MRILILFSLAIFGCQSPETNDDIEAIKAVMIQQQTDWSNHDIDAFMSSYWKSDSLKFYGSSGLTYGWQQTLDNYKKRYPSAAHMGKLNFELDAISKVADNIYYVMGRYELKRDIGDANGVFKIIFKKINGAWKIISDLSC